MFSFDVETGRIFDPLIIQSNRLDRQYNSSYSGIIKLFIDAVSVRKYSETFKGKKIALMGVPSGRAGNLRGMDHLTTALNYLGMIVFPNRLPLPQISSKFDGDEFDKETWTLINDYAKQFIAF